MTKTWITSMSTHTESVVNPLIAACESGFVPSRVELLSNPSVENYLDPIREMIENVLTAFAKHNATIQVTDLSHERDFEGVVDHFRGPITNQEADDVAIDVTPGRKFMSAIAFQVGMQNGADHVYYLHLDSDDYFGEILSTIPRVAYDLIDFRTLMEAR